MDEVCTAAALDRSALASALAGQGIALVGLGLDPARGPRRVIEGGRYDAMETYFDRAGPEGRRMMCSTAAIQVNVGLGPGEMVEHRWRLAHQLGPTLAAAFANSPLMHGVPSGWASGRLAAWRSLDRTRQGPVPQNAPPTQAWARYALDAQVMQVLASSVASGMARQHRAPGDIAVMRLRDRQERTDLQRVFGALPVHRRIEKASALLALRTADKPAARR